MCWSLNELTETFKEPFKFYVITKCILRTRFFLHSSYWITCHFYVSDKIVHTWGAFHVLGIWKILLIYQVICLFIFKCKFNSFERKSWLRQFIEQTWIKVFLFSSSLGLKFFSQVEGQTKIPLNRDGRNDRVSRLRRLRPHLRPQHPYGRPCKRGHSCSTLTTEIG